MAPKIAVVGTSGSGKTTVARRLAEHYGVPHVELDALHWGPNWYSLFVWIVTTHRSRRRRYLERLDRYEFVHLPSQREIEDWLAERVS